MARSSKPRKPYQARHPISNLRVRTQPWRLDAMFGPLEEMLLHIAREGTLEETEAGALLYVSPSSGKPYEVPEAIDGYADIFTLVRSRDPACPDVAPLHKVVAQLRAGAVTEAAIEAALSSLAAVRAYASGQPVHVIADAARSVALRLLLDAADHQQTTGIRP